MVFLNKSSSPSGFLPDEAATAFMANDKPPVGDGIPEASRRACSSRALRVMKPPPGFSAAIRVAFLNMLATPLGLPSSTFLLFPVTDTVKDALSVEVGAGADGDLEATIGDIDEVELRGDLVERAVQFPGRSFASSEVGASTELMVV